MAATYKLDPELAAAIGLGSNMPIEDAEIVTPPAAPAAVPARKLAEEPAVGEHEGLRAELARARAELAATKARLAAQPAKRDGKRAHVWEPTVHRDPYGKGNITIKAWHWGVTTTMWPRQIDDLTAGIDVAKLPADHMLRRLADAARGLPRERSSKAEG